jgi:BirA family transcriptional regulator, biotin operon repressor / biotin---[acetyl-CoA-carboxylase] ligase
MIGKKFDRDLYQATWKNLQPDADADLQVFEKIPSTNRILRESIQGELTIPQVAIALEQTAGRGQWGRQWESELGGLYLSVAISPGLKLECYPHLVMSTAWGIAKILRDCDLPVCLKWPNDLILEGHKLGGIKIETRTEQQQITTAIIGVGINWANNTPEVGISLQSYYRNCIKPPQIDSLEALAALTTYGIISGYRYYLDSGIEKLLTSYCSILTSIGKEIEIDRSIGTVTGVTADGKLKVQMRSPGAMKEICFAPGEISLGYPRLF